MYLLRKFLFIAALVSCLLPTATLAISAGDLQAANNDTNFYDPYDQCVSGTTSTTLVGKDNTMKVMNFLIGKGLTAIEAAGIVGNLMAESGLDPTIQQGNASTSKTPINGIGFGIAQWTFTARQQPLIQLAAKEGQPVDTLGVQLDFLWDEFTGAIPNDDFTSVLNQLKQQTTLTGATDVVMTGYEGPLVDNGGTRLSFATAAYAEYKAVNGITGGGAPGPGGAPAGQCAGGTVTCTATGPSTTAGASTLSATRQNIVCNAKNELALWTSGKLKPSNGYLKYSQNRVEEWCADFASWIYNQSGDPLQSSPSWNIAYVPNIQAVAQSGGKKFSWHPAGGYTPIAGDLAIHGANHVNIVAGVTGNSETMIGGDQGPGPYPGGSYVSQYSQTIAQGISEDGITGYVSPN
jgi:hypothetical protein